MNYRPATDDEIVRELLHRSEAAKAGARADQDLDYERLALLAEGHLSPDDADQLLKELALDDEARRTVSMAMTLGEPSVRLAGTGWRHAVSKERLLTWAVAASLVVGATLLFLPGRGDGPQLAERRAYDKTVELLKQGDFEQTRRAVQTARDAGTDSPRLRNLEAQAVLEVPAATSLAAAGDLPSFGHEISGVISRSPAPAAAIRNREAALELLERIDDDPAVALNRGYVLLALDRIEEARSIFESATTQSPSDPLAWLGLGLASYLDDDFPTATTAFERAAQLDRQSLVARINLAMSLTESGRLDEALAVWQSALALNPAGGTRREIESAIEELRARPQANER